MEKSRKIIGVDIGGTTSAVILGDVNGKIIERSGFRTGVDRGSNYGINKICLEIKKLQDKYRLTSSSRACIGISCGGPLDYQNGIIISPPNLPGWEGVPISEIISSRTGLAVYLENDANASALAEWNYGAGRGHENLIFLTFGTGMGAGLILNNRLYRGRGGLSGEVGHVRLAEDGPIGHNKSGSFEGFCSGGGIARLARKRLAERLTEQEVREVFSRGINEITARDIGLAADSGNIYALEILAESGKYLGKGLSMLMDIFAPEIIIIGGIYLRCQQYLEPPSRTVIQREVLPEIASNCEIVPAGLGERIGDYAALSAAKLYL